MALYTITPMVVAYGPKREKSRFTYMHNFGEKVDIPYVSWLIRGDGLTALVDTGCSAEDFQTHIKPMNKGGAHMLAGEQFADVMNVKHLAEHLAAHGLTLDDIDLVIQTHLDWDHSMNTRQFKKARIIAQKTEWDSIPVHPFFQGSYAPAYIYEELGRMRLELVEGDHEIAPGLRLVYTPGHSAGGQSIVVDTAAGRYAIAGMCTIRENFYPSEQIKARGYTVIPPGFHYDVMQCFRSMQRLLDIAGENVIAFHDSENFTRGPIG